jgi:hypothetical protein
LNGTTRAGGRVTNSRWSTQTTVDRVPVLSSFSTNSIPSTCSLHALWVCDAINVTVDLTNRAWDKCCDASADWRLHHKPAVTGIVLRSSIGASRKEKNMAWDKGCGKHKAASGNNSRSVSSLMSKEKWLLIQCGCTCTELQLIHHVIYTVTSTPARVIKVCATNVATAAAAISIGRFSEKEMGLASIGTSSTTQCWIDSELIQDLISRSTTTEVWLVDYRRVVSKVNDIHLPFTCTRRKQREYSEMGTWLVSLHDFTIHLTLSLLQNFS